MFVGFYFIFGYFFLFLRKLFLERGRRYLESENPSVYIEPQLKKVQLDFQPYDDAETIGPWLWNLGFPQANLMPWHPLMAQVGQQRLPVSPGITKGNSGPSAVSWLLSRGCSVGRCVTCGLDSRALQLTVGLLRSISTDFEQCPCACRDPVPLLGICALSIFTVACFCGCCGSAVLSWGQLCLLGDMSTIWKAGAATVGLGGTWRRCEWTLRKHPWFHVIACLLQCETPAVAGGVAFGFVFWYLPRQSICILLPPDFFLFFNFSFLLNEFWNKI